MEGWVQVYSGFSNRDAPDTQAQQKWVKMFVRIEDGELRCSLSQQSAWPVAIFYLHAADITTVTEDDTRLIQLTLKDDVNVWMIVDMPANVDEWLFALSDHVDIATLLPVAELNQAATGLSQYLENVVNEALPAVGVMEVTLQGKVHRLSVTIEDSAKMVTEQFAKQHKLKASLASTMEMEVLRTQIDASKGKITALKEANKWLRLNSMETSTLRQKVAEADMQIQELRAELAAIADATPKLDAILEEYVSQNQALQFECDEVNERLQDQQESHEHELQNNDLRWKEQFQQAELQINMLSEQVQQLTDKLAAATSAPAPPTSFASPNPQPRTPQPNGRVPTYDAKTDRFAPAPIADSPNFHVAPPNTAPARILSRAERRTLWTPLTVGGTTNRMSETMSPSKLADVNKQLKARLRNTKQLQTQYADKFSAMQQTAKSYEATAQDAEKEAQRLRGIVHHLRESMEHRSLMKVQEENKLLKQQMLEIKGELVRVKRALESSQPQRTMAGLLSPRQQQKEQQQQPPAQHQLPLTTPISETTVKALPLTPSVQSHVLRVIFDKYAMNQVMTRFKFQQFTREYEIISETDLVAGDVDVLFAFTLRTTQTKKACLPKQPMRPTGPYKPDAVEPQHNLIDIKQFESLLSALALRLFLPLIEKSSQTQFYLLEDHEHDAATNAAVEILYKEKLIPVADRAGLIRWAAIYMAETKNAYLENEMLVEEVSNKAAILTKIFNHYANRTEHQTHDVDSTADTEDGAVDYLTFRALSQLAHDFGICPILVEVARLYELYSELDAEAAQGLQKTESSSTKVSWVHAAANIPVEPNRLNYAQYLALLAVVAHQYFPDAEPALRMNELLRWMDKSGGFHILQQHESSSANSINNPHG